MKKISVLHLVPGQLYKTNQGEEFRRFVAFADGHVFTKRSFAPIESRSAYDNSRQIWLISNKDSTRAYWLTPTCFVWVPD